MAKPLEPKIVTRDDLLRLRREKAGRTLVLATGCFDLVHKGHVFFLREAAQRGDILVVGINSDSSVRDIKGAGRPIVPVADRCAVLAEFGCVDYVFDYPERCAGASIDALRPDVFCVGEESFGKYPDELAAAERHCVRVERIAKAPSPSTTTMISRIRTDSEQRTRALISVIYVNWNTRRLLENSLRSLKEHAGDQRLEIIVVDNGSSDGSVSWLREAHPEILVVPLDWNAGFSVGNNEGAAQATGDYLLLLNTDTIVLPSTVSCLVKALEADPTVGCVGARHLNRDGSLQRSMDSFPNLQADTFTYTELHRLAPIARWLGRRHPWWSDHDRLREVDWINGACMLVRRKAFEQASGFDPEIFIYGEEVDLCWRISKRGWKVVFTPHAEIVHLGGASMDHIAAERLALSYRGLVRFYDKHRSLIARVGVRALLAGTILARAIILVLLSLFPRRLALARHARAVITQMGPGAETRKALRAWSRIARILAKPRV